MYIKTKRLVLKSPKRDDINAYLEIRNSEGFLMFNPMPKVDLEKGLDELEEQIQDQSLVGIYYSELMIGIVSIYSDNLRYRIDSKNMSYALNPRFEDKGYMTEALRSIVDFLFNETSCEVIVARVFACNAKSRRMIENLGFKQEGYIRKAVRGNNDIIHDDYLFALIKEV